MRFNLEVLQRQLLRLDNLENDADLERRVVGLDWPKEAETMIGVKRLANIQYCIEQIIKDEIKGDVIECGVWRGGATIFMKAVLNEYKDQRKVFVADSFNGFPSNLRYEYDRMAEFLDEPILKVSKEEVQKNFEKYGVLDDRVEFVEGYFSESLVGFTNRLALLRVDCDLFESVMDVLENLYNNVEQGGFVIIDDFGQIEQCQVAVHMFRIKHKIVAKIEQIDYAGIYWRK